MERSLGIPPANNPPIPIGAADAAATPPLREPSLLFLVAGPPLPPAAETDCWLLFASTPALMTSCKEDVKDYCCQDSPWERSDRWFPPFSAFSPFESRIREHFYLEPASTRMRLITRYQCVLSTLYLCILVQIIALMVIIIIRFVLLQPPF